ncbi:MAG: hypothetical protein ABSB74_04945 [Tepidisphaeraceae bacterium]
MRRNFCGGIVAIVLLVSRAGFAQISYSITDLGPLYDLSNIGSLEAASINDSGEIVGSFVANDGREHAFLQSAQGSFQDLGTSGQYSGANSINDLGQIAGTQGVGIYGTQDAYVWNQNGSTDDLGTFGGSYVAAAFINNNGDVAALAWNGSYNTILRTSTGSTENIGTLGGSGTVASGINDSQQVVGYSVTPGGNQNAFLYTGTGPIQNLGTLGGSESAANAINNDGQIVGWSLTTGGTQHAFLSTGGGPLQDLGVLGGSQSAANGINGSGQVVGSSNGHAFIYSSGSMRDLNSFIPSNSGWTLEQASGINNLDQIVGSGTNSAGQTHAVLLTPYTLLSTASVSPVTAAPPIAQFPAPNMLLRQLPNFTQADGTAFSTPTLNSIDLSTQLLGALAEPLSNQFLKDFASAAGENLHTAGEVGTIALAATNPDPLAAGASLALMVAPNTLQTDTLKSLLQLPNLVQIANYEWGTSGGEPVHAALALVNFSYGTVLANELEVFGSDPVDTDYQSIATPAALPDAILHLPSTGNTGIDKAVADSMTSIVSAASYLQAANDSLDKYAGALQGNAPLSAAAQLDAFLQYLVAYNQAAGQSVEDINSLDSLLQADGFTDFSFDPTAFESLQQQIAANGFDANTTSLLVGMGLTSSDLDLLQSQIASLDPTTLEGAQFGALDSAAAGLSQVTTVPEPSTTASGLFLSCLLLLRRVNYC